MLLVFALHWLEILFFRSGLVRRAALKHHSARHAWAQRQLNRS